MNKKFYFGLALTAGLFASCSSDDLVGESASSQAFIDNGAPAKIEIGLTPGYEITRGTGRVGDVLGAANAQWAGQEFSVLMLKKGTMLGAYQNDADHTSPALLKGTKMTADGTDVVSLDPDAVYYPTLFADQTTAVYDFWGYRLDNSETDGAATPAATPGVPKFNGYDQAATDASYTWVAYMGSDDATLNGADDPTTSTVGTVGAIYENTTSGNKFECTAVDPGTNAATQISVPFQINGTQDIMIATTTSSSAYDDAYLYSAKSARNGIKPTMAFRHLLSSLTFKVKAKSRDISDCASNPTTDGSFVPGYQITNITLRSKDTGELIVAYTPNNVVADADRIIWDNAQDWADPTTLKPFQLQCRPKRIVEAADIKMVAVSSTAVTGFDIDYTGGYVDMQGRNKYTVDANLMTMAVYDSNLLYDGTGESGLPKGTKTTLAAMKTAAGGADVTGYILTYNATDRVGAITNAKKYLPDYDNTPAAVTKNLEPFYTNADVAPVVLGWKAENEDASATVANEAAYDALDASLQAGKGDVAALTDATIASNVGKYFYNTADTKVYLIKAKADDPANAITSAVGEPMMVAPSNDNANSGYQVIVTYKYYKKVNNTTVQQVEVSSNPITVSNYTIDPSSGNKIKKAFEAGKNYNVTITLYSDGEVLNGEATSEPWEDGGDLDAGDE